MCKSAQPPTAPLALETKPCLLASRGACISLADVSYELVLEVPVTELPEPIKVTFAVLLCQGHAEQMSAGIRRTRIRSVKLAEGSAGL